MFIIYTMVSKFYFTWYYVSRFCGWFLEITIHVPNKHQLLGQIFVSLAYPWDIGHRYQINAESLHDICFFVEQPVYIDATHCFLRRSECATILLLNLVQNGIARNSVLDIIIKDQKIPVFRRIYKKILPSTSTKVFVVIKLSEFCRTTRNCLVDMRIPPLLAWSSGYPMLI